MLLDRAPTFRGLRVIAAGFGVVDLGLCFVCRCVVVGYLTQARARSAQV